MRVSQNVKILSKLDRLIVGWGRVASLALRVDTSEAAKGAHGTVGEVMPGVVFPTAAKALGPCLANRVRLVAKGCLY